METETIERETEILHTTENVLYPIIAGIGIMANVLVIFVVVVWEKSRANRTVADMFVINLAVADLLFLTVLPFNMPALIDNGWVFGGFMCVVTEVMKYFNYRASICFLTTMTIDRYFAIVYSLESRAFRTRRNGAKLCVLLWLFCFCISIPVIIFTDVRIEEGGLLRCRVHYPGYTPTYLPDSKLYDYYNISLPNSENQYFQSHTTEGSTVDAEMFWEEDVDSDFFQGSSGDAEAYVCRDEAHVTSAHKTTLVYANFVFFFLLPIVVVMFCYGGIIRVILTRNIPSISTTASGAHNRVAGMVALLVTVFLICWLPFQVFELLSLPPGLQVNSANSCSILKSAFTMLAWSNSAINPILYSFSSRRFRHKMLVSWTYIRYGKLRALALQNSQRTTQTRQHAKTINGSSKGMSMRPMSPTTGHSMI